MTDKTGRIIYLVASATDITEIKRAQEAVQEAREYAESIVKTIREPLVVLDADLRVISANRSFYQAFKVIPEETEGQFIYELGNRQWDIPKLRELLERILLQNISFDNFEVKHDFPQIGRRVMLLNARRLLRKSGEAAMILLAIEDITERKRAEEEKAKIQAQFLQAQKMEAIGILAAGVAHDFNNLLTTIQGYTHLAMMEVDKTTSLYRDLKEIHLAAVRAADLTRKLLLFSRKHPIDLSPLNINRTVDDLLKMLNRLIGEDIAVNTDLEPDLWTVQADAGNIEQVIMNLAVNARDAMPEGGKLTIKTENVTIDEDYCKVFPHARPGKYVCLSVEDTGTGMDKEIIQHIFEPFFSTKEAGRGTGLGLSVVYGIVKQHKGWINVHSEPGRGSTFKVYLPAFSAKLEDETKEKSSLEEFQGSGERILLVEDEKGVRELTKKILRKNGYVVFEAANAKEALDIFEKERGKFHLVLSDVVLPDKSGLQLVHQLLSFKPELRVILSTGYTDEKSQWPIIREKGFRVLQKPYNLPDMLRAIRDAIKPS
jgi:PAS domain S-box-containing protein